VLRDRSGDEHHFGFPEHDRVSIVFTFVASYSDDRRESAWTAHDKLTERGYEVVAPTHGSRPTPLVRLR
jgi:hypothetical protein